MHMFTNTKKLVSALLDVLHASSSGSNQFINIFEEYDEEGCSGGPVGSIADLPPAGPGRTGSLQRERFARAARLPPWQGPPEASFSSEVRAARRELIFFMRDIYKIEKKKARL